MPRQKWQDIKRQVSNKCSPKIDKACDEVLECVQDLRENGGKFSTLRVKTISLIQESLEELASSR